MKNYSQQRGIGIFGFLFYGIIIGISAMVLIKAVPVYINQLSVTRAVHDIAIKNAGGNVDASKIRTDLQKRWEVDYISQPSWKDIQVVRGDKGLVLHYEYEAKEHLFYNAYILLEFSEDVPLT